MLHCLFGKRERYAIPARCVREVVPCVTLHAFAGAVAGVCGSMRYRGSWIPVVDASRLLEGHPSEDAMATRILVLACTGMGSETTSASASTSGSASASGSEAGAKPGAESGSSLPSGSRGVGEGKKPVGGKVSGMGGGTMSAEALEDDKKHDAAKGSGGDPAGAEETRTVLVGLLAEGVTEVIPIPGGVEGGSGGSRGTPGSCGTPRRCAEKVSTSGSQTPTTSLSSNLHATGGGIRPWRVVTLGDGTPVQCLRVEDLIPASLLGGTAHPADGGAA